MTGYNTNFEVQNIESSLNFSEFAEFLKTFVEISSTPLPSKVQKSLSPSFILVTYILVTYF